ncbi:MAG: glycosyltransferase [Bacteroidia bacterium]|nr:glycosyltransferase [Bacteroidia bacterium]
MNPSNGGPCQGIRNSVPALKNLGVHTDVVCMDDPKSNYIRKDDFQIFAVGASNGPWAHSKNLIPWLEKHIGDYDAVIVHGLWQFHVYAVNKVLKQLKKSKSSNLPKVFLMPHGMLDPYFQKAEGRKIKALRNLFYWYFIESKNVKNADGLLFTCDEEMRLAATTFKPYKPKRTINVSYGIQAPPANNTLDDLIFFDKYSALRGKKYLLFLSRIHEKKGVDILLEAFNKVYANNASAPLLVIAGPGMDSEYGKGLKQLIDGNQFLSQHVFITGILLGEFKWSAFYNCQAFVLPSHQENFGIAVAEALACRIPVLISNKVNIHDMVANAQAGIVNDDSLNGTIKGLNEWANYSETQKEVLKNNAFNLYQSAFTVEASANKLLTELKNIL